MRIKGVLLATTALALLAGAQSAQAGELYISVFGGANFLVNSSGPTDDESGVGAWSTDADTGFLVGAAVGTHLDKWVKGLRVELEASYRRNDVRGDWKEVSEGGDSSGGSIDGNMSTFAIMANAWYDIDIGNKVRPYVGGGVGWARVHGDIRFTQLTSSGHPTTPTSHTSILRDHDGFAWQLGAGFHYEVAPNVDVGVGYRYFNGPNINGVFENESNGGTIDNNSHSVMVDLTVGIN
jgi:OOP family OmpA-OmpF porin